MTASNVAFNGVSLHRTLGIGFQTAAISAFVENLQDAMGAEGVPFTTKDRLLAKLAR